MQYTPKAIAVGPPRSSGARRARPPRGASADGRPDYKTSSCARPGAYFSDADGKRYIGHLNSYGPILIGHADQRVNHAVCEIASQVDLNSVGPQTGGGRARRAHRRRDAFRDKVVFMNTGTDALQHALHVARAATGRTKLFKFHGHYHGWVGALGVGAFPPRPRSAASLMSPWRD